MYKNHYRLKDIDNNRYLNKYTDGIPSYTNFGAYAAKLFKTKEEAEEIQRILMECDPKLTLTLNPVRVTPVIEYDESITLGYTIAPEEYTCFLCEDKETCEFRYDEYNTDGDCLAEK